MNNDAKPGTALITGASSGIGAVFARALAEKGYNLILVARREDRLRALAGTLTAGRDIHVQALTADLVDPAGISCVEGKIRATPDLSLLINNAGFGAGGFYYQIDVSKQLAMIQLHVVATARLTRAALSAMVARRRGGVINVASVAGFSIMPTGAMYCSTKAWLVAFSRAVAEELRGTGVVVQALCPGFTHTEFHDTSEFRNFRRDMIPKWMWMDADVVVKKSLRAFDRGRTVCIPGLVNKALVVLMKTELGFWLSRYFGRKRWKTCAADAL